jgi:hypothetical protein
MKRIADDIRQEAIRLRLQERLSLDDIRLRTGLGQGTLSVLLREYPLTTEEISQRKSENALRTNPSRRYTPEVSKYAQWVGDVELSTDRKGHIAEAAVMFRVAILGYKIYRSVFEGNKIDILVAKEDAAHYIKLQVKWARRTEVGRPFVELRSGDPGKTRYIKHNHCDFVVGYDFESDMAYVFPVVLCADHYSKTCDEEYAEAWHLLETQ